MGMANEMTSASELRVTRSSRSLRRLILLLVFCLGVIAILRAQETPAPPGTKPPAAETAEADPVEPSEPSSDAAATDTAPDRTKDEPGVVGPTPGRFEPSEKVRADFDVSFPIDI